MKLFARAAMAAGLLLLALGASASAHHDHTSCAGGAPGVIASPLGAGIPTGPGQGPSGPAFVAPIAQSGQAALTIETLHALYCHQPPGPPPGPATQPRP